jgi:hypothetical protein
MEERMPISEIMDFIKTAGVGIAVVGLWLGVLNQRREYDWRRKRFTVDLFLRSADAHSRSNLVLIVKAFPQLATAQPGKGPTVKECEEIWNTPPGQCYKPNIDGYELKRAILDEFNSIEPIAMAYNFGLVELEEIDKAVGNPILRRYEFFVNFVTFTEKIRGDHPWPSIPKLVVQLKHRRATSLEHHQPSP